MVHPQKYTTPLLDFSEIECSTNARVKCIFDLLTKEFNLIEGERIELYVSADGCLQKVSPNHTLAALNQEYWRSGH